MKTNLRLLINFATLKTGGGQNVAMNFLHAIGDDQSLAADFALSFLVARDSDPHRFLTKLNRYRYYVMPRNPVFRILTEIVFGSYIIFREKYDIIYSYFGFGFFLNRTPQVSGSADSNLFFPEIDFWRHYKGLPRAKKWLVDFYRVATLKMATAVVFENEVIENRARNLFKLANTVVIKPSVNISSDKEYVEFGEVAADTKKGLFLCGWQLNKNIMLIPEIAAELKRRNQSIIFILTAPKDGSAQYREFEKLVEFHGVGDFIEIIGQVKKTQLPDLYNKIDFVLLLSNLESFSNNIIEAWYYGKPLLISDALWARSICNASALYVNQSSSSDIAEIVSRVISDDVLVNSLVISGRRSLAQYPSIGMRVQEELSYMKHVYEMH